MATETKTGELVGVECVMKLGQVSIPALIVNHLEVRQVGRQAGRQVGRPVERLLLESVTRVCVRKC